MIVTIRNKWLLRLAWRRWDVPSYVRAAPKLWLAWFLGDWSNRWLYRRWRRKERVE